MHRDAEAESGNIERHLLRPRTDAEPRQTKDHNHDAHQRVHKAVQPELTGGNGELRVDRLQQREIHSPGSNQLRDIGQVHKKEPLKELRDQLVPINRKHPIKELLEACWHYLDKQNGRSITFEYVMLDGVNDSTEQALELARLLRGRAAKVNLIPFNTFPGTQYRRSSPEAISRFRDSLNARGVIATTRRTRGDDIDAACGQLVGRVRDRTTVRLGHKLHSLAVEA